MRDDLMAFKGCKGAQQVQFNGTECVAGMGFEQSKSFKSVARNVRLQLSIPSMPVCREE